MPGVRWFPGATLSYVRNALRPDRDPGTTAVVFRSEGDGELAAKVAEVRAGLKELGVTKGDRVAAYVPNISEALVVFLATASLGASGRLSPDERPCPCRLAGRVRR
jgi:acetoacetyl-CoA synthetase